jgi:RNA polymerase sigma factor (sigma-70 family)
VEIDRRRRWTDDRDPSDRGHGDALPRVRGCVPPPEDDDALLRRAVTDAMAFDRFYRRTVDDVLSFFRRRVYDVDISADLTAETFAQLLRSVRKFDARQGSARQYLFGIARNQYLLWQRKGIVSRRHRHAIGIAGLPAWDGGVDAALDRVDAERLQEPLARALALLNAPERNAVALRIVDRLPYCDVAMLLGCSEGTARVRVSRGIARLAVLLDRMGAVGVDDRHV